MHCLSSFSVPLHSWMKKLRKTMSRTHRSATSAPSGDRPLPIERQTSLPAQEGGANEAKQAQPSATLVCESCWNTGLFSQELFQQAWTSQRTSGAGYSYETTWKQLHESSQSGCPWCRLVLSTRTANMHKETVHVTVRFRVSSGSNGETPRGVQVMVLVIDHWPHSSYYVYTRPDDPASRFITARNRVVELNTPSTRAMASQCIAECIRRHERCPLPNDTVLPTRVVDCFDPDHPKLHLSHGERGRYVALSYVWGEDQPRATTTDNVDAYLRAIDPTRLPQTIKDAIDCTHGFGVRYLWVDALCILQDSDEDKAREIARMRSIFRNAYFTIIAASAHKVSEGFLQSRPSSSPDDITLPFRCPDGNAGTMSLSPAWKQYDGSAEPVNLRAWCLEERLLSPRSLIYASHTLQYQCQTSIVNVGNAVCGPMIGQRLPDVLFRADLDDDDPSPLTPEGHRKLRWAWMEVVGDYTQRTCTKPGDKLVAFAAIAELFQNAWKCEYLAGLWSYTLVQDLLWYKNFERRFERPAEYRAPSWSWAAVDGHVVALSMDDRLDFVSAVVDQCEILDCEVVPASAMLPLGKVSSGVLKLRATMLKATWNPDAQMPDLYLPSGPREVDEAIVDEPLLIGCAYPDALEDVQEVWAVPMIWNEAMQYAAGLIIAAADEEGKCRRVGYFHSPEDSPGGLSWMLGQDQQEITLV
ncbi:HET-domain-containing protein [Trametes cingulata]|nr:HET-domain-containing protein [Trametes cingulata]